VEQKLLIIPEHMRSSENQKCIYDRQFRNSTNGTFTLVSNALVEMLYVMKIRFNFKSELNIRGNIHHENIKVMNTGSLTVILSVECFIHDNLSQEHN
jgi:hypothetical protein